MSKHIIHINPDYNYLSDYIASIPQRFESEGRYIYGGRRNLIKSFTTPDGQEINVKRYKRPDMLNKFVYSFGLRTPKGQRAFEYPALLLGKGIDTPVAIAYIEQRCMHLLGYSYLITVQCPYPHKMYEMSTAGRDVCVRVAQALGDYAANMHENKVLHLDFSPGNILWEDRNGIIRFSIVDINRMRFGHVSIEDGCRSFARLWGNKEFFSTLVTRYAERRGGDVAQALQIALDARSHFWKRYYRKHDKNSCMPDDF